MQQRISHDFVDDEIVVYRGRSGNRSLVPLLSLGLVLAVVVAAGMLGSKAAGAATPTSAVAVGLPSPAAVVAAASPSYSPTASPSPVATPTPTPSPSYEYVEAGAPLDASTVPSTLRVATIAPQRLKGATLPQARSDSGFAANGTKIAFVAWDSIRAVDLDAPRMSATVVHLDMCSWVPEMASAGDRLAYVLLRPAMGLDDGCGGELRRFEWQVWLTDFSGSKSTLVADGQGVRQDPDMSTNPAEQPALDQSPWRPHVGVSDSWIAWSVPNVEDPRGGSQAVRAVPTADPASDPVSLQAGGRVTQLAVGGSLVAAAVLVGPAAAGRVPSRMLRLTDAPERGTLRTVATIDGPIGVDPDGSSVVWRTGGPTPGVFVADATGTPVWSWGPESPTETGGATPAFAAVDRTGAVWVAATTVTIGKTTNLFFVSRRWSEGAVVTDAPAPRWGRLDGGRLTWIGDDATGNLAAMTVYLDSLAEITREITR